MEYTIFRPVDDGEVLPARIQRGQSWRNISFGINAPVEEFRNAGLWPEVGDKPTSDNYNKVELADETANIYEKIVELDWVIVPKSFAEIKVIFETKLDSFINETAQAKGYDDRISCTVRAGYINQYQKEGIAFGQWMDNCYAIVFSTLDDIVAGTIPMPTEAELFALLPVMVWPS